MALAEVTRHLLTLFGNKLYLASHNLIVAVAAYSLSLGVKQIHTGSKFNSTSALRSHGIAGSSSQTRGPLSQSWQITYKAKILKAKSPKLRDIG